MRAQQEVDRLQRETIRRMNDDAVRTAQDAARLARGYAVPARRSSGGGRWLGILVVLLFVAGMAFFAVHEYDLHKNQPLPSGDIPCSAVDPSCTP